VPRFGPDHLFRYGLPRQTCRWGNTGRSGSAAGYKWRITDGDFVSVRPRSIRSGRGGCVGQWVTICRGRYPDRPPLRSAVLPAQGAMVTDMPESLYQDWHPASPTPASFRTFRHSRSRNQRREEAPNAAAAACSLPTMSAPVAIAPARSAARPVCCSCICFPKPISASDRSDPRRIHRSAGVRAAAKIGTETSWDSSSSAAN
jgi:hypothetical protein